MSQYAELTIRVPSTDGGRTARVAHPAAHHRMTLTMRGLGRRVARFFADGQLGSVAALERSRATGARC